MNKYCIIDKYEDFKKGELTNLEFNLNNCLIMNGNEGVYLSPVIYTEPFTEIVGSWCAISNINTGSTELQYRVLVDNCWSEFLSYGSWCFQKKNCSKSKVTSDGLAKIDTDIITVLNDKVAMAFQYQIIFKKSSNEKSPILKNIVTNLKLINLSDDIIKTNKDYIFYDVPKLNQNIVPNIGGSICSPTTITMLSKFYGHSFHNLGYPFEHEYIAHQVFDYGDNIYGNWCFNAAILGALGEFSYVKRFTGPNELIDYLANVGPVGLSVKGNMQGFYTTKGHLLVCNGFEKINDIYEFICCDPNIKEVEIRYYYDTIKNVWRNIAYCVDNKYNI